MRGALVNAHSAVERAVAVPRPEVAREASVKVWRRTRAGHRCWSTGSQEYLLNK